MGVITKNFLKKARCLAIEIEGLKERAAIAEASLTNAVSSPKAVVVICSRGEVTALDRLIDAQSIVKKKQGDLASMAQHAFLHLKGAGLLDVETRFIFAYFFGAEGIKTVAKKLGITENRAFYIRNRVTDVIFIKSRRDHIDVGLKKRIEKALKETTFED